MASAIQAIAGITIGGVVAFYIAFVVLNGINLTTDPQWSIVLLLLPIAVVAGIGIAVIKMF